MANALKMHEYDVSSLTTDRERVAENIATMVAAIGDEPPRDMSDEEFAACDFEPWQHTEGEWTPPTNEEWARLANPHLMMVRVAWVALHKSKDELIEMAEGMFKEEDGEENLLFATLDRLVETSNMFKGFLSVCDAAMARLMVAGMNIQDDPTVS